MGTLSGVSSVSRTSCTALHLHWHVHAALNDVAFVLAAGLQLQNISHADVHQMLVARQAAA